ncbi:MAG: DNA repair protein RecO [Candidatus Zambryskibacteria bacterium RIFOXYD2_FULL_43_10]|uniref:DNA repair protein RecO n=1 Tax=Candidatus Zambryskibacteria bacterium RIFOXYD2_FULL_43_10 TaxID=1802782 RepID=A0A1G2V6R7_9BACT|nr:MAG: DNA repair protein RecO [Candidatus Zambryskibacteria bacterium RIFOXYD2_FULL_43_10]
MRGIILSERPVREADRIYTIMTRNLGLVRAAAIGVRKEISKLRGSIEPFSLSSISFVKGKDYWRLTSAELIRNIPAVPVIARPLALIEKLVQGEAPNPELFDAVEKSILSPELYDEMFETNLVSKILFHLGYLKESDMALGKKSLIKAINDGLHNSHLT